MGDVAEPGHEPSAADLAWMAEAIRIGAAGHPTPNPHVGAVLVTGEAKLSVGHHERVGDDHAEVLALAAASDQAKDATLYVSLEPCNHLGRTPPCTDAIIAAKVARVVIGCADPNPHVAGGGVDKLRAAGIEVTVGVREAEAKRLIAPWTKFVTTGLPYVTLKLALSLDGRIATRSGASKWVTGPEARALVHALRSRHDAVAVGIGTALADDPRLTVRDAPGPSPLRVVFDTKLRLSPHSRLAESAPDVPTWVIASTDAASANEEALTTRGVEVLRVSTTAEGRLDVDASLRLLASTGRRDLDGRGRRRARGQPLSRSPRRRAARVRRADPQARTPRSPGGRRLGWPRHTRRGAAHLRRAMGALRLRRLRVGAPQVSRQRRVG